MTTLRDRLFIAVVLVFVTGVCTAQDKLRRIEQPARFTYSNTPIQLDVEMDGEPLPSREVMAGPDWLQRLSLKVTNISGREINSLVIHLLLREPPYGVKATPETVGIEINFELPHSEPRVKVLPAGATVRLRPPVRSVDYWTKYALTHGMQDIEKVILDIGTVGFTDKTGWNRGYWSRKDPDSGRQIFLRENPER